MKRLSAEQLKSLSGFFNTVASAWFVAATINPLFSQSVDIIRATLLAIVGITATCIFMFISLGIIKDI